MSSNQSYSPYGAFEMKASYQKNLLMGNLFVLVLTLTIVSVFWILSYFADPPVPVGKGKRLVDWTIPNTTLPIDPNKIRPQRKRPTVEPHKNAIPVPINDDLIIEEEPSELNRRDDSLIYETGNGDDTSLGYSPEGSFGIGDTTGGGEIYPGENQFVPFEKEPEMYYYVQPKFPRLCRIAGIEGVVTIKVLIGKDGLVKKAKIAKSSEVESFDIAALAVAFENKFTPALQNSTPISLWVSYRVEFKLR